MFFQTINYPTMSADSTPITAPCSPSYAECPQDVYVDCFCREHANDAEELTNKIEEIKKELLAVDFIDVGKYCHTHIPDWLVRYVQKNIQESYPSDRDAYVVKDSVMNVRALPTIRLTGFDPDAFSSQEYCYSFNLFNNHKDDILSVLPTVLRILPQCLSNGSLIMTMFSWLNLLKRLCELMIRAGRVGLDLSHFQVYQTVEDMDWWWRADVITEDEEGKKVVVDCNTYGVNEYVKIEACNSFTSIPTGVPKYMDSRYGEQSLLFGCSEKFMEVQELMFLGILDEIKLMRETLRTLGYDYVTRDDVGIDDLFKCKRFTPPTNGGLNFLLSSVIKQFTFN